MAAQIRQMIERNEHILLCEKAAFADRSVGRKTDEPECELRTCFQRDRDRIIHCKSFRRLKHKTQVFLSPEGDHYRTRLTHTLEVAQIARTIARSLRLNEDLTEAIALAHDLGHTPFGHAGERALNDCYDKGFHHYEQSGRVLERIEKDGQGLNLTGEVIDGVINHTTGTLPFTLEGQIVRASDRIAYINHDIDDAQRAGILYESDIPSDIREALGDSKSARIDTLVKSVINHGIDGNIGVDDHLRVYFDKLHEFLFTAVYTNPIAKNEEKKVAGMIEKLFTYYISNPDKLPKDFKVIVDEEGIERAAVDHIASMSDRYAVQTFDSLFVPKFWQL